MPIILDKQWHGLTPPHISKEDKNTTLGNGIRGKEGGLHAALWIVGVRVTQRTACGLNINICDYSSQAESVKCELKSKSTLWWAVLKMHVFHLWILALCYVSWKKFYHEIRCHLVLRNQIWKHKTAYSLSVQRSPVALHKQNIIFMFNSVWWQSEHFTARGHH